MSISGSPQKSWVFQGWQFPSSFTYFRLALKLAIVGFLITITRWACSPARNHGKLDMHHTQPLGSEDHGFLNIPYHQNSFPLFKGYPNLIPGSRIESSFCQPFFFSGAFAEKNHHDIHDPGLFVQQLPSNSDKAAGGNSRLSPGQRFGSSTNPGEKTWWDGSCVVLTLRPPKRA